MTQYIATHIDGSKLNLNSRAKGTYVETAKFRNRWQSYAELTLEITAYTAPEWAYFDSIVVDDTPVFLHEWNEAQHIDNKGTKYILHFYGIEKMLFEASPFLDIDSEGAYISKDKPPIVGNLELFGNVLCNCINYRAFNTTTGQRYKQDTIKLGTCPAGTKHLLVSTTEYNAFAALLAVCSAFKTHYTITINPAGDTDYLLNFGVAPGVYAPLAYGRGKGLYRLDRKSISSENVKTILTVLGSSKNLPQGYGKQRLELDETLYPGSIIADNDKIQTFGAWNDVYIAEDIMPEYRGEILGVDTEDKYTFYCELDDFDPTGGTLNMLTGNLAGSNFRIAAFNAASGKITVEELVDSSGFAVPSVAPYLFATGDTFTIVDIPMPQAYIEIAQQALAEAGQARYLEVSQPRVAYNVALHSRFVKSHGSRPKVGMYFPITDTRYGVNKAVQCITLERNLLAQDEYEYTNCEVADNVVETLGAKIYKQSKEAQALLKHLGATHLTTPTSSLQGTVRTAQSAAVAAAEAVAALEAEAARIAAEAYADGILSNEEAARIADVAAKLTEAKQYAASQAAAAESAAKTYAEGQAAAAQAAAEAVAAAEAEAAELAANAYADGVVDAEEARAIAEAAAKLAEAKAHAETKATEAKNAAEAAAAADATAKANAAKSAAETYALAKANLAETTAKAYADGIVDAEEARAIADATAKANAAKAAAEATAAALDAAIQVGGRNLMINSSSFLLTGTDYHTVSGHTTEVVDGQLTGKVFRKAVGGNCYYYLIPYYPRMVEPVKEHTNYVWSIEVRSNCSGRVFFDIRPSYTDHFTTIFESTNDKWVRISGVMEIGILQPTDMWALVLVGVFGTNIDDYVYYRNPKIEKGNKATDWTPAPEDVDADATAKADAAQAAAEATAAALDDAIQVGGRNLFAISTMNKNVGIMGTSSIEWAGAETIFKSNNPNNWALLPLQQTTPLVPINTDFIISFDLRNTTDHFGLEVTATSGTPTLIYYRLFTNTTSTWQRFSTQYNSGSITTIGGINTRGVGEIRHLKIELGNKATDWTPAPEDVQADATTKMNSAKDAIAQEAGYTNFADMASKAALTVNGLLNSQVINVDDLFANTAFISKLLVEAGFINYLTVKFLETVGDANGYKVQIKNTLDSGAAGAESYVRLVNSNGTRKAELVFDANNVYGGSGGLPVLRITDNGCYSRVFAEGLEAVSTTSGRFSYNMLSQFTPFGMVFATGTQASAAVKGGFTWNKNAGKVSIYVNTLPRGGHGTVSEGFLYRSPDGLSNDVIRYQS